ncbi:MAG: TldD/PmbA family protein [Candidatus Auribacter fodinae]|jgi:PmbA protein|uniref:TldD/PmbA family protein n=1 Tax=Candidatus Auribacter fodinae TaxID=2093366 RepID=A0A3A4QV68_9BACT|nr:MAG: TldD/PmbA family protein [Candidatus Auribacter fodinae]
MSISTQVQWEQYAIDFDSGEIDFKNGKLHAVNASQVNGTAMRVLDNGKIGFVSSSESGIQKDALIQKAAEAAQSGSAYHGQFASSDEFCSQETPFDSSLRSMSVQDMTARALREVQLVQEHVGDAVVDASISASAGSISIKNHNGVDIRYKKSIFSFAVATQIIEDTSFFYAYSYVNRAHNVDDLRAVTRKLLDQLVLSRTPMTVETGQYPVLFTPNAVASLILTMRYALDAHAVARGISPLAGKIGKQSFDERFTLIDDPLRSDSPLIAPCDDEGVAYRTKNIVASGVLNTYITDLDGAARLNMEPTGNALRCNPFTQQMYDYNSKPAPWPTNWSVKPGDQLSAVMRDDIRKGVLVDQLLGLHTGNLLNGDFSCTISTGYVVEKGSVVGRIKDCVVSGNIYSILKNNLIGFSSDTETVDHTGVHTFPHMYCKDISIAAK